MLNLTIYAQISYFLKTNSFNVFLNNFMENTKEKIPKEWKIIAKEAMEY